MVNSDQTWNKFGNFILDYGFLKFAENWNVKKFVYATSLGFNYLILYPLNKYKEFNFII